LYLHDPSIHLTTQAVYFDSNGRSNAWRWPRQHDRRDIPTSESSPIGTPNWSVLKQQDLGPTQTCRQLRAESLPISRRKKTHIIALYDLPSYVKIFPRSGFGDDSKFSGKVAVDLYPDTTYSGNDERVSIKPLIEIYSASNFKVEFLSHDASVGDLQQLLSFDRGSTWEAYVRDAVFMIEVRVVKGLIHLAVYTRPGHNHDLLMAHSLAGTERG
jgi:hypothetical protein